MLCLAVLGFGFYVWENLFGLSASGPIKVLTTTIAEILVIPVQRHFASGTYVVPAIRKSDLFCYSQL